MKKRVLLIGASPTSSLIAYNIKHCSVLSKILEVHVWEKSRGVGGRFSTSRNPKNQNSYLDLGAQYLTQTHPWSKSYFENLESNGLLRSLDTTNIPGFKEGKEKQKHYVCCKGTGSIVKKLFEQANILKGIQCNTRVSSVVKRLGENGKTQFDITAEKEEAGTTTESFDIVISTIPIPQVLQLHKLDILIPECRIRVNDKDNNPIFDPLCIRTITEKLKRTDSDLKMKLQNVKYTTRYALGLFYDENIILDESEHIINFVQSDVIRYWSLENRKRAFPANTTEEPTTITVHTSVEFGAQHIDDEKDSLKEYLLEKTKKQIKFIQKIAPSHIKCHKWKYSQVLQPYAGAVGVVAISTDPLFLVSGDGMSYSGFEGCIFSAEQTVKYLQKKF